MTAPGTVHLTAEASPRLRARIAGVLYLIIIVTAMFSAVFVHQKVVVLRDAAATAANILAQEPLYRAGGAAMLIALMCDTALSLLFYQLFRPVHRTVALLVAFFRLMSIAILAVNLLNHYFPLILLKATSFPAEFGMAQRQALALGFVQLYDYGFKIAMIFFGMNCVFLGRVIFKSWFLPRALGVLMAIAGLCYLAWSFSGLLAPPVAARLFGYLMPVCFIAELALTLWLLVAGVNVRRWNEQATAAAQP
jgi:hypothetical protein